MKKMFLLIAIVLLILLLPNKSSSVAPVPVKTDLDASTLYSLIQKWRADNGLNQYETAEGLCKIASLRLEQVKEDWSHSQFQGNWTWEYTKMARVGENLAKDYTFEGLLLIDWLKSPTHRANLDDKNFDYSCIRCSGTYCVQMFGSY